MSWQRSHAAPGPRLSSPHSSWLIWNGGVPTITLYVLTNRCEWPLQNLANEVASVWRNAIGSVRLRWQLGKRTGGGQQGKCSRAPCQGFALERLTSQMGAFSCHEEMGEGTRRGARMESHSGKRRPLRTASSPKTGPKWVCRGLVDVSTIFYRSTRV